MEQIKEVLNSMTLEVSDQPPASMTVKPLALTKIKEVIRAGCSKKANKALGIPARYHGKALPDTKQGKEALVAVLIGRSIFMTGKAGSGKTHMAVALTNEWFADGLKDIDGELVQTKGHCIFLPAVELFLEIKQTYDKNGVSEKAILDKYSRVTLLVIDDLGAEKISDWSRTVLYLLIDRRYRDMKQTIITSNLSQGELAEKLDDRIASRLSEMGLILDLGKKDWRIGG